MQLACQIDEFKYNIDFIDLIGQWRGVLLGRLLMNRFCDFFWPFGVCLEI